MQMGSSGKNAYVCSYSYPHSAMRTKYTPSQTTLLSINDPTPGNNTDPAEEEEAFAGFEERQPGLIPADVSYGEATDRKKAIKATTSSLEVIAMRRTRDSDAVAMEGRGSRRR